MQRQQGSKAREIRIGSLGLGLLVFGAAAHAQGCAPPRPWSEGRVGQPEKEVAACLQDRAWETRNLDVPIQSIVAGIVSQCEVRVTFMAGPAGSASRTRTQQLLDANDRVALNEALDDVTWARRCAGR